MKKRSSKQSGIKDTNGVEICEGDLCEWWYNSEEDSWYGPGLGCGGTYKIDAPVKIVFDRGAFGFYYGSNFKLVYGQKLSVIKK